MQPLDGSTKLELTVRRPKANVRARLSSATIFKIKFKKYV